MIKHKSASMKLSMARNTAEQEDEELKKAGSGRADEIQTLPLCPKALVHDVVQFDLNSLDFLHKLGEGGFGSVRACKFRRADLRGNSPAISSSTATTLGSSDDGNNSCASGEEQKIAEMP